MVSKRPWLIVAPLFIIGIINLYLALIWSPPEAQMGNLVRIMYFHVSSAWIAFLAFFITFACAVLSLIRKPTRLKWDRIAVSSAEIGVFFTSLTLISGSLWAKPIWNTWWTWDPRLTTTLILWFLYIGYLLLRGTIEGAERRARASAIYAIVAFVDVPIIHESVVWWRSIHPTVIDSTGFHMPPSMVITLMFGFVAFLCLFLVLLMLRTRYETGRMHLAMLRQQYAEARAMLERGQ